MGRGAVRNERLFTLVLANTIRTSYYQLANIDVKCKTNTHSSFRKLTSPRGDRRWGTLGGWLHARGVHRQPQPSLPSREHEAWRTRNGVRNRDCFSSPPRTSSSYGYSQSSSLPKRNSRPMDVLNNTIYLVIRAWSSRQHGQSYSPCLVFQDGDSLLVSNTFQGLAVNG